MLLELMITWKDGSQTHDFIEATDKETAVKNWDRRIQLAAEKNQYWVNTQYAKMQSVEIK